MNGQGFSKKQQVIAHLEDSIDWVQSLNQLPEEAWRLPIEQGKWSVAEVIRHLVLWDEFIINKRLPYLFTSQDMPVPPDVEVMNEKAAIHARNDSKEETVDLFEQTRSELVDRLNDIEDIRYEEAISLQASKESLYEYLEGIMQHDVHHFEQIKQVLNDKDA
ncbi:DinB family protein [Halobacillus shinanisalinarum]|uniref:DinB family protein n=1 Tax=Halobacillus shinanisalinarum TaxID=2932258 RepID=A0ABY4GYW5_9BACI|nr:DinB family protein [Halobacillus shinanisalinarum]UOQ92597.1 DinB family protein [Halobacillus shinanisalinarum]